MAATLPTTPAVPHVHDRSLAYIDDVVPDWAQRFAREDSGAAFISVSKMQREGYLRGIAQLDKAYDMVDRYCDRIEALREQHGGLLRAEQLLPRENELPGIRNGRRKSVSKRLWLIAVLGTLPTIKGFQP